MELYVIIKRANIEDEKSTVRVYDRTAKLHFKCEGIVNQSTLLEQLQICQRSCSSLPEGLKRIVVPKEVISTRVFYTNLNLEDPSKLKIRNATCQFLKQLDELVIKGTSR